MSTSSDQSQPTGHSYTVEIRFYGDHLDPTEISQRMGLEPSGSLTRLATSASSRPRRPFWAYNGHGEQGFVPEWRSLEDGLTFLARRLAPLRSTVVDLSHTFDGIWWCGHFQSGFDGGPKLSPSTLAEIAAFELPLFIDNYFAAEEP